MRLLKFGFALGPLFAVTAFFEIGIRLLSPAGRPIALLSASVLIAAIASALVVSSSNKWLTLPQISLRTILLSLGISIAGLIVVYAPSLVALANMLGGPFPRTFFSVDTPYHLSQVFGLIEGSGYPPASLNNLGATFNYHFGTQLLAASISNTIGILPHNAYLGITPAVFMFSGLCGIAILGTLQSSWIKRLLLFFPLLCELSFLHFSGDSLAFLLSIEGVRGGFPHMSITAASFLILFLLISFEISSTSAMVFAGTILVPALIVLFKSPFIFSVVGFFVGYVSRLAIQKSLRGSHLLIAVGAALFTLITIPYVSMGSNSFEFKGVFGGLKLSILTFAQWLTVVAVPVFFLAKGRLRDSVVDILPHIFACLLPVALYLSFDLSINGIVDGNLYQVTLPCSLIAFFGFFRLIRISDSKAIVALAASVLFVAGACLPMLVNRIYNLASVYKEPKYWHEYVNNQNLGECLANVPVKGSILVTNDLRYPAENFSRNDLQVQIPALFGHQMFAGNLLYEKRFLKQEFFKAQESLVSGTVETVESNARIYGWTHAVLFKRKPSISLPFNVICENSEVQIVAFSDLQK